MSTPMEFSTDEGDDGTWDWPSYRNREAPNASDSEFSSSNDEGGVEEYVASPIHEGNGTAIMGRKPMRSWGPVALAANLLRTHACRSRPS